MGVNEDQPLVQEEKKQLSIVEKIKKKFTPEHELNYYLKPSFWMIYMLMLLVIICGTANRVMFKKMLIPMKNYSFFTNQLTSFIYLPVFWPIVLIFWFFTDRITPEMKKFPIWKYGIMGCLDALAGLLMTFGGAQTSGPMQLLLSQLAIPFTMIFSIIVGLKALDCLFKQVLKVNYKWNHYVGAIVIIAGVFVSLYNQLINPDSSAETSNSACPVPPQSSLSSGASSGADGVQSANTPTGLIIFFLSSIPTAFSGVYKEIGFKGTNLDVYLVNAWVATFQFVIGMFFLPLTKLKAFGGIPFKEMPKSLWDGWLCFLGTNSRHSDQCEDAWMLVCGYLVVNIAYNVVLLMMIKYGSASLFYVASAIILPSADICFTFHWVMGCYAESLSVYDIVGLIVILIGILVYRFLGSESAKSEKKKSDDTDGEYLDSGSDDDDEYEFEEETIPVISFQVGEVHSIRRRKKVSKEHTPRTEKTIRNTYLSRLGIKADDKNVSINNQYEYNV
eukprot:TRINITY_DN157_c0_g1_i1.p1 TRINITY_DN157_c0_g1~~TRINITY_DN157_c0_g1_i1.p1  ORF type:complete len:503 (+),score=149.18 TRINITY_DN157_c0_g1_i1:53-1561(+)